MKGTLRKITPLTEGDLSIKAQYEAAWITRINSMNFDWFFFFWNEHI